nr:hypothetical protein [Kibdelosporangium sp. MJ126-NF4]CTQ98099.1 hypothetical protein [Kibdelosporangium sp. MJ126-NF4]
MDARQLAFLDDVETDLTASKPSSKAAVRRIGVAGSVAAAGAAFFALTAAPASAAPADTGSVTVGTQSTGDVGVLETCFQPNRVAANHLKRCGNPLASVSFTYIRTGTCGPGGNGTFYEFNRWYSSSCGSADIGPARTPCF